MRVLLVVYDNDCHIHFFPTGMAYIAAVLRNSGCDVEIYSQDIHHYPKEHLTAYLDSHEHFDLVGVGVIGGYFQYRKLLEISEAIAATKNRPTHYLLGGYGPSPEPEFFLRKTGADIAVIGEGEETMAELAEVLSNKHSYEDILGIAYMKDGEFFMNPRRPLIQDIDSIPWPAFDMFPIDHYRLIGMPHSGPTDFVMPVLSGRGCTFLCNFCYRMDEGYRERSPEAIIEEISFLQKEYGITYIKFDDDLLMCSKSRTETLCKAILNAGLTFKWFCNGRLNYATEDLLKLMKEAGCVFINYGIEAFDDVALRTMNKALTTKQIVRGIEATQKVGISPGFNIIFGNIGESKETLQKGVDFLLKYDDGAQLRTIRPVTPYPGSDIYYHAIQRGLLEGPEDFYENKHLNSDLLAVNFTDMSDDEFHLALMEANKTLIENYYQKKKAMAMETTERLYVGRDTNFRGYRQT